MTNKERRGIEYLKQLPKYLHKLSYQEVCIDLNGYFPSVPISIFETDKIFRFQETGPRDPTIIFRARENIKSLPERSSIKMPFKKLDEISIIPANKLDLITTYGRCNRPKHARFYCSTNYPTACIEAITSGFTKDVSESKSVTVGAWKITEPLVLAQINYSEEFLNEFSNLDSARYEKMIAYAQGLNKHHLDLITKQGNSDPELAMQLQEIFAEAFATYEIRSDYDYAISNFYCDKIFIETTIEDGTTQIDGILYPSVNFSYQEWNLVLHPRALRKIKFLNAMFVWVVYHGASTQGTEFIPLEHSTKADDAGNLLWNKWNW